MSRNNPWTPLEKQLMRERYPHIGPKGMAALVNHSRLSCRTMAQQMGLTMTKQAMGVIHRSKTVNFKQSIDKPRKPFDDVPREYVKVQSIFRVGQRYAVQEAVCEA